MERSDMEERLRYFAEALRRWLKFFGVTDKMVKSKIVFDPTMMRDGPELLHTKGNEIVFIAGAGLLEKDDSSLNNAAFVLACTIMSSTLRKLAVSSFEALLKDDKDKNDRYAKFSENLSKRLMYIMQSFVFPVASDTVVYDMFMREYADETAGSD